MKIKNLKCPKCTGTDLKGTQRGPHVMLVCRHCGAYIKFANKDEKRLLKWT
jgi:uncharacterized Zn finger protein